MKKNEAQFVKEKIIESEIEILDIYNDEKNRSKPLRLLIKLFKGHYLNLFISSVFFIIKSSPTWALPIITAHVIDTAVQRPSNWQVLLMVDFIIGIVLLAQNIPMHMLHIKYFSKSVRNVEAALRGAMIRKLQQLSISFHKEMESGKIQSKVMRDVEAISEFSSQIFQTGLGVAVNMSITVAVVMSRNITVFFMFLLCAPFPMLITKLFKKKLVRTSHDFRIKMEQTSSAIFDMEELIPVTRAHALENTEIKKLSNSVTNVAKSGYRLDIIQSVFGSASWVLFFLFQFICLFICAVLAIKGKITVGEVALYQTYFGTLTGYVSDITRLLPTITKGAESIGSIGEVLSVYDIEDNSNKKKIDKLQGKYEFKNVDFSYDENSPVLNNFSLTVNEGETIALVGESGSGKSTIINLVIGFNKAQSGEVLVDGQNIKDINLHSYRRHLSIVPQNTILFSGTVRENITYGKSGISEERLKEVIKMARLEKVIEKLPNGLETLVGEHGSKLSGGQRQRISIARAIIRDPKVIIFDEATSALDSLTEREIQLAINNLTADRTTFIVAHRLSTIKKADKIAVIRDGKCVEYGTYDELIEKRGEFYNYKKVQS